MMGYALCWLAVCNIKLIRQVAIIGNVGTRHLYSGGGKFAGIAGCNEPPVLTASCR